MTEELKIKLKELAQKYEVSSFCNSDPSQFIRRYSTPVDIEVACFITALLSFGNRKQFIPKIQMIFELADKSSGSISKWLKSGRFKTDFISQIQNIESKFYRFYSYKDMLDLFEALSEILTQHDSFGSFIKQKWNGCLENKHNCLVAEKTKCDSIALCDVISSSFQECAIVPKGKNSANKRINMFLRWMVRVDSPVDIGLWAWFTPTDLIIPLDTHVLQQSVALGLIEAKQNGDLPTANRKTALQITEALKQVWPTDPCKGDFALFGLGVSEK